MYNKVFLIGRLVRDPEIRVTVSGITVARFTIAIDRIRRKGQEETPTDFLNVVAWRRLGEIAGEYLKKGKLVSVEGALRKDAYEKNGEQREWYEITADTFQMLDRANDIATKSEEFSAVGG